ncbi:MAG TPA: efflux RND transporter periplasmic adaptor subunit [Bacteroidales bacterium]|nr:efflux RND transporter periplasmic adaptor subunit [Bacteroidales bacterium]
MKNIFFYFIVLFFALYSCKKNPTEIHGHEGEEITIYLTEYSGLFEVFAEANPFVAGETSNILAHFTKLADFKPIPESSITMSLIIGTKSIRQTITEPLKQGIYSFDVTPEISGIGKIIFDIKNEEGNFQVIVPRITVFAQEEEAHEAAEKAVVSKTNTTVFTKEQSWKIDYSTEFPLKEPFGQVIKTTALVQSTQGDEVIISAKTNGIVMFPAENILEGKNVSSGQDLFTISGNELANDNSSVRFAEAKNNYEKAKTDFERSQELAKEKIVSEKDLLNAKNQYENAKATFDNLNKNFSLSGQKVSSPINGFVKQLFVQNGQYVEAGYPIASISQNKTLMLTAEVQQKHASLLSLIYSANIRTLHDNQTYSFEQLNGKVLSCGKSANGDNYLIPVNLQIENKGNFVSGGFVEIYLKTISNTQALTIPNSALLEEQGNYFVYVQITPELFEKKEVKIAGTDGVKTEIVKGITCSERIVTKGAILIKLAQATGTLDAHSGHVH